MSKRRKEPWRRLVEMTLHPCVVCGKGDPDKPMAWKRTPWCCGRHEERATLDA